MRRVLFVLASLVLSAATAARAIPGATDRTPAATLLVPFFQTGIDAAAKPHDTLIVVHNTKAGTARIHYEVWDIDGRNFAFTQYNESGAVVASGLRRLDHAVTVIPFTGTQAGWYTLRDLPNVFRLVTQFFAFSVNLATPAGGAGRWENAFEGYITP